MLFPTPRDPVPTQGPDWTSISYKIFLLITIVTTNTNTAGGIQRASCIRID